MRQRCRPICRSTSARPSALLSRLYDIYIQTDAELVEINPLALTKSGSLMALDCKFVAR